MDFRRVGRYYLKYGNNNTEIYEGGLSFRKACYAELIVDMSTGIVIKSRRYGLAGKKMFFLQLDEEHFKV